MARKFNSCNDPELWGGIECTINRVNDNFRDQLELAGHYQRPEDVARFAALGIKRMRYPVLWERHAPARHQRIDWRVTEENIERLGLQSITPIVGLVHHGSGPRYTNLLDPDFGSLLAEYAFEVSSHFPQLTDYTPVNEPLTTARFSGLYGFWYPHHRNDRSFAIMLLNQLRGTVLSMKAVRSVNPTARLIQTEDLGKTHSTPALADQARFENDRRWLSFDILCGNVIPGHPMWRWLTQENGIKEEELMFFVDNACPPDSLGLNYYVTSERWLDEDLSRYPLSTHGGNGRQTYADTEVVRANPAGRLGLETLGREVWERYQIPLALTEVHLHCTREEQMRWLAEMWQETVALCRTGVPVIGFTVWSLLGAFEWDSLLTKNNGYYESGVFALQQGHLRETALVRLIMQLGAGNGADHPLVRINGWWHDRPVAAIPADIPLLLLLGPNTDLARAIVAICRSRGIPCLHSTTLPADTDNPGADPRADRTFWATLRFDAGEPISFSAHRLRVTAAPGSPPDAVIQQVLDLVIDEAQGNWNFSPDGGLKQLPSETCAEVFLL